MAGASNLHDIEEIRALQHLYADLLDQGRADEIATTIFTEDAVEDHGHGIETAVGREQINDFFVSVTSRYAGTMHAISNISIDVDGDRASSRAYFQAYHWLKGDNDDPLRPADFVTNGIYIDELRKTSEGWRVSHRLRRNVGPSPVGIGALPDFLHGIGGKPERRSRREGSA